MTFLTINPEFGPVPYQPTDPHSGEPLADIWEVCLWMTRRFRARWAQRPGIETRTSIRNAAVDQRTHNERTGGGSA